MGLLVAAAQSQQIARTKIADRADQTGDRMFARYGAPFPHAQSGRRFDPPCHLFPTCDRDERERQQRSISILGCAGDHSPSE
jgi:hypothetical protein